jgi:hypothetical protein
MKKDSVRATSYSIERTPAAKSFLADRSIPLLYAMRKGSFKGTAVNFILIVEISLFPLDKLGFPFAARA